MWGLKVLWKKFLVETTYTVNLQYLPKHKKWRVQKSNVDELHRVDNGTRYDEGIKGFKNKV